MKTIKVYYNKTLGMSEGKISSQCCHAVAGLVAQIGYDRDTKIIILGARATKFFDLYDQQKESTPVYMQVDLGYNEVEAGEHTAFAYLEK
jgi:peptidyl-tRNA hydrolase